MLCLNKVCSVVGVSVRPSAVTILGGEKSINKALAHSELYKPVRLKEMSYIHKEGSERKN